MSDTDQNGKHTPFPVSASIGYKGTCPSDCRNQGNCMSNGMCACFFDFYEISCAETNGAITHVSANLKFEAIGEQETKDYSFDVSLGAKALTVYPVSEDTAITLHRSFGGHGSQLVENEVYYICGSSDLSGRWFLKTSFYEESTVEFNVNTRKG